jgi:hypothetical protein
MMKYFARKVQKFGWFSTPHFDAIGGFYPILIVEWAKPGG